MPLASWLRSLPSYWRFKPTGKPKERPCVLPGRHQTGHLLVCGLRGQQETSKKVLIWDVNRQKGGCVLLLVLHLHWLTWHQCWLFVLLTNHSQKFPLSMPRPWAVPGSLLSSRLSSLGTFFSFIQLLMLLRAQNTHLTPFSFACSTSDTYYVFQTSTIIVAFSSHNHVFMPVPWDLRYLRMLLYLLSPLFIPPSTQLPAI